MQRSGVRVWGGKALAGIHGRNPFILTEDLWLHRIDPTISGDQPHVDEAIRVGVTGAEQLRIDQVHPDPAKDDGPHIIEATDA